MVDAKAAGVMFTANPADGDTDKIYIESNWGLGESVVAGEVTPDSFLVAKADSEILTRSISQKKIWFTLDPATGKVGFQEVPEDKKNAPTLTDDEVREIARVGALIEDAFRRRPRHRVGRGCQRRRPGEHHVPADPPGQEHRARRRAPTDRLLDFMTRDF